MVLEHPAPLLEYQRYHIETRNTPGIAPWPSRFRVRVGKLGLARLIIGELIHTRFNLAVVASRPCMYGVFSGPIGGFSPRAQHCVGCLRCTVEFPQFVTVSPNPQRRKLGDSFFDFNYVDQVTYEAETGLVPVKGAGYRGRFGGQGWDGMWTDMSEIVRPTRDGIHGREFISTSVDIGSKPDFLVFGRDGRPQGETPQTISLPVPFIFDAPPPAVESGRLWRILSTAAEAVQSLAVVPAEALTRHGLRGGHLVPLVQPEAAAAFSPPFAPRLIELDSWDQAAFQALQARFPASLIALRAPFAPDETLLARYRDGVRVFHLTASYHGRGADGQFVRELIRQAHLSFVEAGLREAVTLIGSGGMIAAEVLPKAIICGLDLVALDTPLLVALQGRFDGKCVDRANSRFVLPRRLTVEWGEQRLKNLCASWRDQLLEILGAMGLREVRRLRGEVGRAMFMHELEAEAFAGIEGYER
jgi:hypothetical protein